MLLSGGFFGHATHNETHSGTAIKDKGAKGASTGTDGKGSDAKKPTTAAKSIEKRYEQ